MAIVMASWRHFCKQLLQTFEPFDSGLARVIVVLGRRFPLSLTNHSLLQALPIGKSRK